MVNCGNCGAENPANHAFCSNCGSALGRICPHCSTPNDASNKFCFNCGTALTAEPPPAATDSSDPTTDPGERRLVSVLFADLVGFTTFSEGRDPEDVRGMLTRFYERCREIIGRYGGTTDKFIGDAVMGVWGAAEAHEDDAERATRAALELIDMVQGLGGELGIPDLAARAGVLSGAASVGSGGNEQGLVVGDLVNTASRLQTIAPPGSVFVGSSTRDLVGSAIEFTAVGEHRLKGKDQPVEVFEALRVIALSTTRTGGDLLEGPFVGRGDELRLLKDQLHATGRESRARLVSVIGEGGIGKSRLAAELIRYIDGIAEVVYYHRGRSPSYGDGVTFWALGEMIRQRAGITEGEDPGKARMKLRTMVAEFAPAEEDQRWIEPRLAAVIGLAESPPGERAEHFAALRAFFQAISTRGTVLMVFEDLHWADEGLLDFIEELAERTTSHAILVLSLARPELLDRRPDWATSRKRSLSMHLSRLDDESMRELVGGLAPGLSDQMIDRIAERTAGVPLHAVEFVRMLLNTGQLVREGDGFRFVGLDEEMPIPDSVNAIIGARIDRLDPEAQAIIRDGSVLGLAFTLDSLARMRDEDPAEIERGLTDLVRREIVEFDEDPRSPERGQYRFVQGLIREVAIDRLSRQERVNRHLAAAAMFEALGDPELAGVVASHYADAVDADPENRDLVDRACQAVVEAAERASDLKSDTQAATLYQRAADMTPDEKRRNELLLEAAGCLTRTGREDRGADLARVVIDWAKGAGDLRTEERAVTTLANTLSATYGVGAAADLAYELYRRVDQREDPDWAELAQATSRVLTLSDRPQEAIGVAEQSLPVMERLGRADLLLNTLINKGTALFILGAFVEGGALLRGVAEMAAERDLIGLRLRAVNNLFSASQHDKKFDLEMMAELEQLIQRVGDESWILRGNFFGAMGRLDHGLPEEAVRLLDEGREMELSELWADGYEMALLQAEMLTGGFSQDRFDRQFALQQKYLQIDDPQLRDGMMTSRARLLLDAGRPHETVEFLDGYFGPPSDYPDAAQISIFAAAQIGDQDTMTQLIEHLERNHSRGRVSRGLRDVARAYLLALRGDHDEAEKAFFDAEELWSKTQVPLSLAYARAVFALLLGVENELAAVKAVQARRFFEEAGYVLHLEGIMSELPDTSHFFELDPFDRPAAGGG